ncbi:beta-ketoacyl synthase chain length factor [Actinokineospora enzanensis]|uniref:beta-ketoacyl synthase chain length factor n=1 Tax=Actinokineospora enzanensis TaxID=155975 RepID=UPI00036D9A2B|nr:beta-ketoacyl synthase chain length factor [Actinokineospora enzanensis]
MSTTLSPGESTAQVTPGPRAEAIPLGAGASARLAVVTVPTVPTVPTVDDGPTVLASARWPESDEDTLPAIAGFVVSTFNPLVAEVAERCLRGYYGAPPATIGRTAVVLASVRGDVTTADTVAAALAAGKRVPPLLFFQSNPNAVVGYVTSRWGMTGPVVCTSPTGEPMADAMASAGLLFAADEADAALVIVAEQASGASDSDRAAAVLVTARGRA